MRVLIITTVTEDGLRPVLDAIAAAGGGVIEHYTHCSFTVKGNGTFMAVQGADPHVGEVGALNQVEEWRIETFCDRTDAKAVIEAIRAAHPYETPVIYAVPLLDEGTL